MVENSLQLPTDIQITISDDSIDHYMIDNNILKKSKTHLLSKGSTLCKKSSENQYSPTLSLNKSKGRQPYEVILFYKYHNSSIKDREHYVRFFENLKDTQRYYSGFIAVKN